MQTILEHLGSAHDDASLAALVQVAKSKIRGGQQFFDLDVLTPTSPVTASPTVVGSSSHVLWEVLQGAYDRLGFDTVGDETFKKLVLARVVEPTSKQDTIRVLLRGRRSGAVAADDLADPGPVCRAGLA